MRTLVLASGNKGKLRELNARLQGQKITIKPQSDFNMDEAEETGLSFIENAIIKARHASRISGLPALADDSGLEVDALYGAPGIYSARYAGAHATDQDNNQKLLNALKHVQGDQRSARFQCALALIRHASDPTPLICLGTWDGIILSHPQGEEGFGYDPLFQPQGLTQSAAQLDADQKNRISHRGQAMDQLTQRLPAVIASLFVRG